MRNLGRKTIVMIASLIVAVVGASAVAQSSKPKPSTQNSARKEKHSNDEIADWIISHTTIPGPIYGEEGRASTLQTVVTKYPDACTLRIKTTYDDFFPHEKIRDVMFQHMERDFKVPMASIDLDRLDWMSGEGACPRTSSAPPGFVCTRIDLWSRDDKPSFFVFLGKVDNGIPQGKEINEPTDYVHFWVQDAAMAKRMFTALTDLVMQCGGKPAKPPEPEKKEIY